MPKLGWLPDPHKRPGEKPDFDAGEMLSAAPAPPPAASAKDLIVDVFDQGALGSCVAQAGMQALRAAQLAMGGERPPAGSRLMGYYCARLLHHATAVDSGTYIRLFFEALNRWGFCPETAWPYVTSRFAHAPPWGAWKAAIDQRSPTVYRRIYDVGAERIVAIKQAIAKRRLVVFGTDVSVAFTNGVPDRPLPPPVGEPIAGGHAMVAVGYDGDAFEICNSWGTGWGRKGFCTFSAEYLAWDGTRDLWVVDSAPPYQAPKASEVVA